MAENKTQVTKVSVASFIATVVDDARRRDLKTLLTLMQKVTGEKAKMWGPSIIGFGSVHYVYDSGREGDMPLVGFSPRKAATVVYGVAGFKGAESALAKLGKHSRGKGCLYLKTLSEVDLQVLEQLIRDSVDAKRRP